MPLPKQCEALCTVARIVASSAHRAAESGTALARAGELLVEALPEEGVVVCDKIIEASGASMEVVHEMRGFCIAQDTDRRVIIDTVRRGQKNGGRDQPVSKRTAQQVREYFSISKEDAHRIAEHSETVAEMWSEVIRVLAALPIPSKKRCGGVLVDVLKLIGIFTASASVVALSLYSVGPGTLVATGGSTVARALGASAHTMLDGATGSFGFDLMSIAKAVLTTVMDLLGSIFGSHKTQNLLCQKLEEANKELAKHAHAMTVDANKLKGALRLLERSIDRAERYDSDQLLVFLEDHWPDELARLRKAADAFEESLIAHQEAMTSALFTLRRRR